VSEPIDAVVVGARCAGSAAAIALARAGRRVVVLDRVCFPADTISTHLVWPGGLAEIDALGALDRVEALGAPRLPEALAGGAGHTVRGSFSPTGGIDYAMCVRRIGLDAALVATAREAGAGVREGARVIELVWQDDRVAGVRYRDAADAVHELRAPLVVGADGRRSTVARLVGADTPYRSEPSGRACFYAYWRDARSDLRGIAAQWREGPELGTAFPCDGGQLLVLIQPPVARLADFDGDLAGAYRRTVYAMGPLAERLQGCEMVTKVRSARDIASYFRRSSGPGWALAGDAGHFKDPVTAQGIRDALRYGRLLGEDVAAVLSEPAALDVAVAAWERRRERDCLEVYQWTNILARGEAMTALEVELYRAAAAQPATARELLDVFSRTRRPGAFMSPVRAAQLCARALARDGADRSATLAAAARELSTALADARERRAALR
jgi:flavin-dependent dehydrogenase